MNSQTVAAAPPAWRLFDLRGRGGSVRTEILAGITSFLAAAYLLAVIPSLLAAGGMDRAAVTTGVIIVFVGATLFMAFYADLPFMVGPGIGGSVLVGPTLAASEHVPWQTGLGIACVASAIFVLLTVLGLRQVIANMIPAQIKLALGAAIGLFIAVLGFHNAGLVTVNARSGALMLSGWATPQAYVALFGMAVMIVLHARRVPGAILWAILAGTVLGIPLGVTKVPAHFFGLPASPAPVALSVDLLGALSIIHFPYLFAFFASEFFSTMGTTLAVGAKAGLVDDEGNMPNIGRPFVVDSVSATLSPWLGVPSATALIESAAGAESGGRTGLTALAAAVMFALMLLVSPIALMIPAAATAPALVMVGLLMFGQLRRVDLTKFTDGLSAVLMVLLTLLSNSFGTGIAGGLLGYVLIKLLAGEGRDVSWGLYVLAIPLAYYFYTVVGHH